MAPTIIGLLGRSRSGKDTVANLLKELYPLQNYNIVRLSAPIKEAARALFLFSDDQLEGSLKETVDHRWGITPRQVFQTLTRDTMGYMGQDFFTKIFYHKYEAGLLGTHIIIPDIRYSHDIDEIHRRGGLVIKIVRDRNPVHYSCENHIDAIHNLPTLHNNGTLKDLKDQLKIWKMDVS